MDSEANDKVPEPLDDIVTDLIDYVTLGLCFEMHRACKAGTVFLDDTDLESDKQYAIVNERGRDVFGQVPTKKQYECVCPNCDRSIAASRFAPHLEKCMGMGRNSSRLASRRLKETGKKETGEESDHDDNTEDQDWSYYRERRPKRIKKDRSKKGRNAKSQNGEKFGSTVANRQNALPVPSRNMIPSCPSYEAEAELIDEGHDVSVLYQWEIPSNVSPSDSNSTSSSSSRQRIGRPNKK